MPIRLMGCLPLLLCLAGCQSGSEHTAYPAPETRPVEARASSHFDADIDTLERVMGWTIQDMHWGQSRLVNEVTALHAAAVNDRGDTIDIRAQKAKDGGVDVQVKVGHFGNDQQEQQFLRTLGRRIEKWQKQKGLRP